MVKMSVDDFNFKLIGGFKGYNSTVDKTILDPGWAVLGSKNVYKKRSGTWAVRSGLKHWSSEARDATEAGVVSEYVWGTSLGEERPLRVANSKLQVFWDDNGTWYDLITSLTLTAFSFAKWWDATEKKDRLIMVNNDDDILHWSGGITKLLSSTTNTLTKNTDDGYSTWAQAGFATNTAGEKKIKINGTEYTYTGGETTATLTGVTPDPSGEAVASVCIQSIITEATKPTANFKNTFIKVIDNQLHCLSYTSRSVYISSQTSFTDFTVPSPRIPGAPALIVLDSTPKGIAIRQGKAHIFAGVSDLFIISYEDITVDATLNSNYKVDKKQLANLQSCLGFEFIDTIGDTIVYLSQENQLLTYGDYRNVFQPIFPPLSLPVYDELSSVSFTGGELRAIGDFIYIIAPNSGKVYLHQSRQYVDELGNVTTERIWHPPQIMNISRVCVIGGVVMGYSNANPQLYQIWDTDQWADDTPQTGDDGEYEQALYECILRLSYQNKIRQGIISFDKVFYEGYITRGTELKARTIYEYQGAEAILENSINTIVNQATILTGEAAPSLGDSSLGDNPIGDGVTLLTEQELLPKFKAIVGFQPVNCSEFQLEVYSKGIGSRWEILTLGANYELSNEESPVKWIKK